MFELFTIGHSNHSLEQFIGLLGSQGIDAVIDVRSAPYSRYCPQYNKDALEISLKGRGVEYIFLGKELGGKRNEESCYVDGRVKFELISHLPIFQVGLERVIQEAGKHKVALMCAESEPLDCHRTILVCRQLKNIQSDLQITHILSNGTTESHEKTLQRLVRMHKLEPELFGELTSNSDLIEKAYYLQAEKMAYSR